MSSQQSELPKVWISYDHTDAEGDRTYAYEGRYAPDGTLPFDVESSAGKEFKMDGLRCELLGDFGGHAVYRRIRSPSSLYAMSWEDFAQANYENIIELNN